MTSPVVLLNAAAGVRAQLTLERLRELFAEQGSAVDVVSIDRGDGLCAAAKAALERGSRTIVAAGGDGTVNAVASCVAGTEAVLGVLPLGTLNHFAKDLGIPLQIEEAVATVVGGQIKRVDVGEVNGRTFVNNSSIGLYPCGPCSAAIRCCTSASTPRDKCSRGVRRSCSSATTTTI
jgi:diacylglycerol kinase family enzyme